MGGPTPAANPAAAGEGAVSAAAVGEDPAGSLEPATSAELKELEGAAAGTGSQVGVLHRTHAAQPAVHALTDSQTSSTCMHTKPLPSLSPCPQALMAVAVAAHAPQLRTLGFDTVSVLTRGSGALPLRAAFRWDAASGAFRKDRFLQQVRPSLLAWLMGQGSDVCMRDAVSGPGSGPGPGPGHVHHCCPRQANLTGVGPSPVTQHPPIWDPLATGGARHSQPAGAAQAGFVPPAAVRAVPQPPVAHLHRY